MAYTTIDKPSDYFETVIYTGNGGTNNITGLDFAPNWVWCKSRSDARQHALVDTVRGATKELSSNLTSAESTISTGITAFNSDGFSLGSGGDTNNNGSTFVSWNWKAGTSFTNDASSTGIGSIDSSGSVSTAAGFSIITYSGTDGTATVAHGLGVAPDFIWFKRRNASKNNTAYHSALGNTKSIYMDNTSAASTDYDYFADTSPTSSVFTVKKDEDYDETNASGGTYVAWCFAEKQGYSKFGSYTGNGNADGSFIWTGQKSAFVMVKKTSGTGNWFIFDSKRSGANGANPGGNHYLKTNSSDAEVVNERLDILSNGFKFRTSNSAWNGSGETYIYMAFAENPFVTGSSAIPTTAR